MTNKKSVTFKSKLAIGLVFVMAVIYTFYHVSNLIFSQNIITIASGISTHSETVAALLDDDVRVYRTDLDGSITFNINQEGIGKIETTKN